MNQKSRVTAGVLAILLGGLGIHKFYMGKTLLGIVYILFCWTSIPSIIGLIEGILYLVKTDEEFQNKYLGA
jgi:TM2 domain-containing membrane protein YozV